MSITKKEIQHVARLARLDLTATEEDELLEHFDKILTYMEKLKNLDTTHVEPTAHAITVSSALREDRVTNVPHTDALLANAPAREDHFFKVPKIIE